MGIGRLHRRQRSHPNRSRQLTARLANQIKRKQSRRKMPAGSVLLVSGRLYHGAGANAATRPRLGVVIDYIQPWLRPCESHTLSTSHTEARRLPQRLQELLGFNQPTPYLGFINGRHPRDWLMNHESRDSVPGPAARG